MMRLTCILCGKKIFETTNAVVEANCCDIIHKWNILTGNTYVPLTEDAIVKILLVACTTDQLRGRLEGIPLEFITPELELAWKI